MTNRKSTKKHSLLNKIFLIHLSAIFSVALIFTYIYFINATTLNAAKTEDLDDDISQIRSEISQLEFRYIEVTKSISIDQAEEFELSNILDEENKIFAKINNSNRLTLNEF